MAIANGKYDILYVMNKASIYIFVAVIIVVVAFFVYRYLTNTSAVANMDVSPFIAYAKQQSCADERNELYLINGVSAFGDNAVFNARAGNCADYAYANVLFLHGSLTPVCSSSDSIAGPQKKCTTEDPEATEAFDAIIKNLDKTNFGFDPKNVAVVKIPF